jgi:hypothetical protein
MSHSQYHRPRRRDADEDDDDAEPVSLKIKSTYYKHSIHRSYKGLLYLYFFSFDAVFVLHGVHPSR